MLTILLVITPSSQEKEFPSESVRASWTLPEAMDTSTSTTSQPSLDARHLDAQLPPDFPRGDEAAIDAVMQLAAFTEQQSHHHHHTTSNNNHHNLHNSHSQDTGVEDEDEKNGRKRKADGGGAGGKSGSNKLSKEDISHQDHHQNWAASFANHSNEFEHLMHQAEGGQQGNESQQEGDSTTVTEGDMLTRHGRPLSNTKRAAQNRAAQRAFRERRDQHVKEIEAKARQVDEALSSASMHKQRYEDLLKTIAGLRADNQSLRLAISALGGNAPPTPQIPHSLSGLEELKESSDPNNGFTQSPALQDLQGTGDRLGGVEEALDQSNNSDNHLDGLSAVAVAAAAAHAINQKGNSNEVGKDLK